MNLMINVTVMLLHFQKHGFFYFIFFCSCFVYFCTVFIINVTTFPFLKSASGLFFTPLLTENCFFFLPSLLSFLSLLQILF